MIYEKEPYSESLGKLKIWQSVASSNSLLAMPSACAERNRE